MADHPGPEPRHAPIEEWSRWWLAYQLAKTEPYTDRFIERFRPKFNTTQPLRPSTQ